MIEGLPLEEYPYLHPTRADLLRRLGRIDAAAQSSVRLQWDPDHHPSGAKLERRAIQLGLRGPMLEHYANEWIVDIEDLSDFVADQRQHVQEGRYEHLVTPREEVLVQQHRCPRLSRPK